MQGKSKNKELQDIIDDITKKFEDSKKQKYNYKQIPRSASSKLESLTSVMAIIMLGEKCYFHREIYPRYLYTVEEIIAGMV